MRGQITVFIIVGLLVVFAFGITIYTGTKMKENIEQKGAIEQAEQIGIQPIQDYITSCLTIATLEGLSLIGRQGGAIYQSQGGLTPDRKTGDDFILHEDPDMGKLDVSFMIVPPEGNIPQANCQALGSCDCEAQSNCLFYSNPPKYPFEHFPRIFGEEIFVGYYGINKLPALYKISSETGLKVQGSLQENLEEYISNKVYSPGDGMMDCINWEEFELRNYEFETDPKPTVTLLFANETRKLQGERSITVQMNWPVKVIVPGEGETILRDYAIREYVRLATIYYTAKQIIDNDITNITYVPEAPKGFLVEIQSLDESNSFIRLIDTQSIVESKPFEFWIPRKNRIPALWKIETTPIEGVPLHVKDDRGAEIKIVDGELVIRDICPVETYTLTLQASDPDEEGVSFEVEIPGSSDNQIPERAANQPYRILVYAKDQSDANFDFEEIPLTVVQCPVR